MTTAVATPADLRLSPRGRLEALADPGSLQLIRTAVMSRRLGDRARPGDGVLGGLAHVDGRPVACYAQDAAFAGGSLGEAHADTIVRVLRMAGDSQIPVVGFVESGGARLQEGVAALSGYARIFSETVRLSGRVPHVSIITGVSAGGGSYSPALTDFVVMTEGSAMFLTGPAVVREVMGEDVDAQRLGGPAVHERTGVCAFRAADDPAAVALARRLLGLLPTNSGQMAPIDPAMAALPGDPGDVVPAEQRKVYDVREVVRRIVDSGELVESAPRWARNLVTAFARIDGRPVGVVANQPRYLGGVLDADSAQKGARFVRTCNAYNLPLVVLVDTPGFLPGTRQEEAGVIRHGAKLLHAFAEATVPRVTVVLRKAYGGAYITMNCRDLGADLVLAWPDAEIGIMGASHAVRIVHRREIEASDPDTAEALAREYAEQHLRPAAAAACGAVDEIVEPRATRSYLNSALSVLRTPRREGDRR